MKGEIVKVLLLVALFLSLLVVTLHIRPVSYVLVYRGKYFDWYAYRSTWDRYNSYYLSQVDYPDRVYEQLVEILGIDILIDTPDHRLYLLVNQRTGGAFATWYISEIGKGPGIGVAYDAWFNVYSGKDYWSTERIAHEIVNLFTGQIVAGWPVDWWADTRSPFPYAIKIVVEQNLGHYDAAEASLKSADPLTKMFLQLMSTYGSNIYSRLLKAIRSDGWSQWFTPNPSKLLSEYVVAYLPLAAGINLADQINSTFSAVGITYQLDPEIVQDIWNYRQYLQQFPRDDPRWESFRHGDLSAFYSLDLPRIKVTRTVSKSLISVEELIQVSIIIANNGTASALDISLQDVLPEGFQIVSGVFVIFYNELSPSECRTCNYTVKVSKEGTYIFPPVIVTYKDQVQTMYTSTSNTVKISVG
ncbi:DUF11 domain-containing protein [Candidatus Bathyarchaeota archaeon]|nr:DUF11 domain-containing protein [Candidatus Bathyarchaeota archaeon]